MKAKSSNTFNKRFEHVACMFILATIMVLWGIITPTSAAATEDAHEAPTVGDVFQVDCDFWNVRVAPDYGAEIACTVEDGMYFQIAESVGLNWYRIESVEIGYMGNCYVNIAPNSLCYFSKLNGNEETTSTLTTESQTTSTTAKSTVTTATTKKTTTTTTESTVTTTKANVSTLENSTTTTTTTVQSTETTTVTEVTTVATTTNKDNGTYKPHDKIKLNSDSWNLRSAPEYGDNIVYVAEDGMVFLILKDVGNYWYRTMALINWHFINCYINITPDSEQYFTVLSKIEPSDTTTTTESTVTTTKANVSTLENSTTTTTNTVQSTETTTVTEVTTVATTTNKDNGTYKPHDKIKLNSDSWNLRSAPEYGDNIVYVAEDGMVFLILKDVGNYWYRTMALINWHFINCYINITPNSEQYFTVLSKIEPSNTTTTTEGTVTTTKADVSTLGNSTTTTTTTVQSTETTTVTEVTTVATTTNKDNGTYKPYDIIMLNSYSWNVRVAGNSDADIAYTAEEGQLFQIVEKAPGHYWYKVEDLSKEHSWNYIQVTPECEKYFTLVKSDRKSTLNEMIRLNGSKWNVYKNYQSYNENMGYLYSGEIVEVLYTEKSPWLLVQREYGRPVWTVVNNDDKKYFTKVSITTDTTTTMSTETTTDTTKAISTETTTDTTTTASTETTTDTIKAISTETSTDTTTTTSTETTTDTTTTTSTITSTDTTINTTSLSIGDRVVFHNTSWYTYKEAGQDVQGVITNGEEFLVLEESSDNWYLILRSAGGDPVWIWISYENYYGNFSIIKAGKNI